MKIKNKALIISFIMTIIMILSSLFLIYFIENNYENIKYKKANQYYQVVKDDKLYAKYLVDNGFIVTKEEIDGYTNSKSMVCNMYNQEIIVYGNQDIKYYATFNPNISHDLIYVIKIVTIFYLFTYLLSITFIFLIQSKLIYTRLEVLKKAMNKNTIPSKVDMFNDEITTLNKTYIKLINQIQSNALEKDNLIFAISHELKNPVSNIYSAMEMAQQDIPPYNDQNYLNKIINEQLTSIDSNILKLVNFYKLSNIEDQQIDLLKVISKFTKEFNIQVQINTFNFVSLKINSEKFNLILSNIFHNIIKHGDLDQEISIIITKQRIIFINHIKKDQHMHSTKVGNTINTLLANNMNMKLIYKQLNDTYITTIIFNNNNL